jgi:hypothetical protein
LRHDVRRGMPQGRERRRIAVEVAGQLEVTIFFRQWCARQSVCVQCAWSCAPPARL